MSEQYQSTSEDQQRAYEMVSPEERMMSEKREYQAQAESGETHNGIESILKRQNGRMVLLGKFGREDEAVESAGLGSPFKYEEEQFDWVKQVFAETVDKFPGIYADNERQRISEANYNESGGSINALGFAGRLWEYMAIDAEGDPVVRTPNSNHYFSASETDFQEAKKVAIHYRDQYAEHEQVGIDWTEDNGIQEIDTIIEIYQGEQKPKVDQDNLYHQSVTDAYMQYLAGGTPREGLGNFITDVAFPDPNISFLEPDGTEIRVVCADKDVLTAGKKLAQRYFALTSQIVAKDSETFAKLRNTSKASNEEKVAAYQKWCDTEWEHKDEALAIAQELKELTLRKLEFQKGIIKG